MLGNTGKHNFYDEDGRLRKDHPGYKEAVCVKCGHKFLTARDRYDLTCMAPECESSGDTLSPALK